MNLQVVKQLGRFAFVGAIGFVVDVGLTLMLIEYGSDALMARAISMPLAILTTWRLNRALTFGASPTSQSSEGVRYFIVAVSVAIVNYAIFAGLLFAYPNIHPALAITIAVVFSTGVSFYGYRSFAFKTAA